MQATNCGHIYTIFRFGDLRFANNTTARLRIIKSAAKVETALYKETARSDNPSQFQAFQIGWQK